MNKKIIANIINRAKHDHKSRWVIIGEILVMLLLISYAIYGLVNNDFVIAPKTSRKMLHFHGITAYILSFAVICCVVSIAYSIFYRYSKSSYRKKFDAIQSSMKILAFLLFMVGFLIELLFLHQVTVSH